jgi:hypothetical protein
MARCLRQVVGRATAPLSGRGPPYAPGSGSLALVVTRDGLALPEEHTSHGPWPLGGDGGRGHGEPRPEDFLAQVTTQET